MKRILLLLLLVLPILVSGQRLKIGKQLEKAPGINYMVLTDINGEQYYTPMSTVLGSINTDQSLGTATLVGNNLVITERNVLTGAITATYTINLAPYMQTLTAVNNGNGTVTLNMTGDPSPELIDICNIVSTHCNSDLTVSATGLVTFTDNAGNNFSFNLTSPTAGNDITYNNGLYFSETVTALSYNPATHALSYVNEAGATNTITMDVAGLTFNAGTNTLTYTAENGVVTNIVLPADVVTTITNTIAGNRIATYTNENGVAVDIDETITTIVNNGDGTYTFTNEAGAAATFPAQVNTDTRLSLSVVNDSLRVDVVNIVTGATVSTSYIDNVINQPDVLTTLAYNSTTHTLTYTDENGGTTNLPLDVATMTYNATTNTITYTAEDGAVTNIALPVETVTTLINNGNGTATYTSENGTTTTFPIGYTNIADNGDGTWTYTYPNGTTQTLDVCALVADGGCLPTIADNGDGTYSFDDGHGNTSVINVLDNTTLNVTPIVVAGDTTGYTISTLVDGVVVDTDNIVFPADAPETVTTITNTVAGHKIADYNNELGAVVPINESIVSFASITNGYQFTAEDGTVYPFTFVFDNSTPSSPQLLVNYGATTVSTIPLNSYDVNISTTGGFTLNPLTDVITITETDGETHTIDLTQLRTTVTSTDGSVQVVTSVNPDGSTNYDLSVGVPNAHILATTSYDVLNPLTGWVAPSSPITGNTVEVKFTDGTVANYTFDGTVWGLDFAVTPATETTTTITGALAAGQTIGTYTNELGATVDIKQTTYQNCSGAALGQDVKVHQVFNLPRQTGFGVVKLDGVDCFRHNDEYYDISVESYAGNKSSGNNALGAYSRILGGTNNGIAATANRSIISGQLNNDNSTYGENYINGYDNTLTGFSYTSMLTGAYNNLILQASIALGQSNQGTYLNTLLGGTNNNGLDVNNSVMLGGYNTLGIHLGLLVIQTDKYLYYLQKPKVV